jgi:DNA-binding CsgD family transcriptional regulator
MGPTPPENEIEAAELRPAGLPVPRRRGRPGYGSQLSPRENEIALLAAAGHTNRDIAAKLYLSDRTVKYHIGHVMRKLEIASRRQLRDVLPERLVNGTAAVSPDHICRCPQCGREIKLSRSDGLFQAEFTDAGRESLFARTRRTRMRPVPARLLAGLSAIAIGLTAGLSASPAFAATGLVDGTINVGSTSCSWTNATTSNVPPNTLTINDSTVHASCNSGSASLTNSPTITFNDTAGTASSAVVDVSATEIGVTCGYKVTNVTLKRSGTTRTYTGGPFTATKTSGSFLCPSTETVTSATLSFH